MGHRRCDSDETMFFRQVRSGELLAGNFNYEPSGRVRTEATVLPNLHTLKHSKSQLKKEWLQRSNRLLQIVNRTSQVIADMQRNKVDRGYYKLPIAAESKSRKHSHADRIEGGMQSTSPLEVLKPSLAPPIKMSIDGQRRQPLKPHQKEKSHEKKNREVLQFDLSHQTFKLTKPGMVCTKSKPDNLRSRLLEKLGDLRNEITIDADKMKLQARQTTENLERTIGVPRTAALSHSKTRQDILNIKEHTTICLPYSEKPKKKAKLDSNRCIADLSPWRMEDSPLLRGELGARFEL